jgi:antitoxin component of RelBE/YafQ-DinJ toxin-antitoxin module
MAKETMNLVIEDNLKKQFKAACVLDGVNMSDVVSKLITDWLTQRESQNSSKLS